MKKGLYFLTLAAMTSMPILAQDQPDGPVRTDQDSKVIYYQDFEKSYESWSTDPSDSIVGMSYYDTQTSPSASTVGSLSIYPIVRDTTLYLYDIVDTGGEPEDFSEDDFSLPNDKDDPSRQNDFDLFGADGGQQYLKYYAGLSNGATNGVQPNYRRNLDVRGVPIEEMTSYRISMLLKVESLGSSVPTFRADLRRGTSRCNSPLSMGYQSDEANYMYNNSFEFETTEFEEGWDRVTFMAYFTTDSIAQRYMYAGSYNSSWADFWSWTPDPVNSPDKALKYVVQPDHYYLRLAFSTDSTIYSVDNLSLTKSWIGGVEHYKDMLRVDFGYDTDMDQICAKAKAETNIDAVELPGEYFKVWGLDSDDKEWYEVEINSAEYHGDGYMYMWTKPFNEGGIEYPNEFEGYDSVLVTFHNPVDREDLCLHYDGKLFPKANDIEWIKAGKILPDFSNEISTMNPHIGAGVYSLKNLPPVMQAMPWEDGSFGLDGNIRELTFNFSKQLDYDNIGEASTKAFLRVTKSGVKEIWTVKESTQTYVTFQRPAAATDILDGGYQFEILNIKGSNTDYSDNVVFTWEFGDFDLNPSDEATLKTDWRKEISSTDDRRIPTSVVLWNRSDGFNFGDGNTKTDCGLFFVNNSSEFDCGLYVSALKEGDFDKNWDGHMFLGLVEPIHMKAGKYSISYANCTYTAPVQTELYFFEYSRGNKSEDEVKTDIMALTEKDKTLIASYMASYKLDKGYVKTNKNWPDEFDRISYIFDIPKEGDYVIDMRIPKNNKGDGNIISNVTIKPVASISAPYVTAFNKAMTAAKELQAMAQADVKYQGNGLETFGQLIQKYEGWKNTAPSAYTNAETEIKAGIADMQLRTSTVDNFLEHYGNVADKLAEFDGTENMNLKTVQALQQLYNDNAGFDFTAASATNDMLNETVKSFDDGIDAIDARLVNMDLFSAKLKQINDQLNDTASQTGFDEFARMQEVYENYKDADLVTPTDDELAQMYDAICDGYNGYVFKIQYIDAMTRRIKALYALNEQLGWDFNGQKDEIKSTIDALQDSDAKLESLLEAAAKYMIQESFAEGKTLEGTDVSAIIPNYCLIAVEEGQADMEDKDNFSRIARGRDVSSVFPNWTVNYSSGSVYPGAEAFDWKKYAHTFVAGLFTEVSTTCEIITDEMNDLPSASYKVKADFNTNNVSNSKFTVYVDGNKIYDQTLAKKAVATTYSFDSVKINGNVLQLRYKLSSASNSNHVHFAGVGLEIECPIEGVDYSSAAEACKAELDAIATFVDTPAASVQTRYYGIDGRMIDAPKAGQIAIRKTALENGSTVVEKILVK